MAREENFWEGSMVIWMICDATYDEPKYRFAVQPDKQLEILGKLVFHESLITDLGTRACSCIVLCKRKFHWKDLLTRRYFRGSHIQRVSSVIWSCAFVAIDFDVRQRC